MPTTFGTPAYGDRGAVAAPHYLASLAGANVLRDGGSAVDAALAANMVLGVVWPHMCGPGGDLFAQVWSPADVAVAGLNASGRAGAAMTLDAYRERGQETMPQRGPLSVTVPGAVSGWYALHARWGRLDMQRVARDAIAAARDGFRVTRYLSEAIAANVALLAANGGGADVFAPDGRIPEPGDVLVQSALAESLTTIARDGPPSMYGGSLGARLAEFVGRRGSLLTADDFAAHEAEWVAPIGVEYRGVHVSQLPPNTQGIALLQMLQMLESDDLTAWAPAERIHQLVERKKLAFADRDAYVADPACADVPTAALLDPAYAGQRAAGFGAHASTHAVGRPSSGDGDTIYLCAADRDGLVVSLIQSLFSGFGSGVHVSGTGITLHNRGGGFRLVDGHPNVIAPAKRPFHTLMPGLALRGGQPWLAFGTRGADGQPQTGLQLLTGLLDLQLDLQEAMEAPRWVHSAPGDRYPPDTLVLESRIGELAQDLAARGHDVRLGEPVDHSMGTAQMIQVDRARGCYVASTDPRGDGIALAF